MSGANKMRAPPVRCRMRFRDVGDEYAGVWQYTARADSAGAAEDGGVLVAEV